MRRLARGLLGLAAALGLTLVLLEAGTWAAVRGGLLSTPAPHHGRTGFWWGDHPQLGVWHRPGAHGRMGGACYAASYRINSAGARDAERPRRAERPRVVVLGDSFLEGWGVAEKERLSNQLQRDTGIPHLNFAMAHFGPYQELLAYRGIAAQFDHDAVLASVVPINDIADADLELARRFTAVYQYYRYRPYLVEGPDGFAHFDYRELPLNRWLRLHTYFYGAFQVASRRFFPEGGADVEVPAGRSHSFFYDFEERQAALLEEIYGRLAREAHPRPVAVLMIPTLADLQRHAVDGAPPLSARLAAAAARDGWHLVDLLPPMAAHTQRWGSYFFPCDYHWNRYGNEVAAGIVRNALDGVLYHSGSAAN